MNKEYDNMEEGFLLNVIFFVYNNSLSIKFQETKYRNYSK